MSGGAWVIDGVPDSAPVVGAVYVVDHSRKGRFTVRVLSVSDIWLTGEIVEGYAAAMLDYNERGRGDEITIRDAHARLFSVCP